MEPSAPGPLTFRHYSDSDDDDEEDSEISDAEKQGYCSDSCPAKINMKVLRVRRNKIKKLYNDHKKVKTCFVRSSLRRINAAVAVGQ